MGEMIKSVYSAPVIQLTTKKKRSQVEAGIQNHAPDRTRVGQGRPIVALAATFKLKAALLAIDEASKTKK